MVDSEEATPINYVTVRTCKACNTFISEGEACMVHVCHAKGCDKVKMPGSCDFCEKHCCKYIGCTHLALEGDRCPYHQGTMVRLDVGKTQWELMSFSFLSELANVCTYGAKKYPEESWRIGYKYKKTFGAALRHVGKWICGEMRDPESGCHHLAHAAWNLMVLVEWDFLGRKDLDDRAINVAPIQGPENIKEPPKKVT